MGEFAGFHYIGLAILFWGFLLCLMAFQKITGNKSAFELGRSFKRFSTGVNTTKEDMKTSSHNTQARVGRFFILYGIVSAIIFMVSAMMGMGTLAFMLLILGPFAYVLVRGVLAVTKEKRTSR